MDGTRINKITVNVDKRYGEVKISLYKTNELIGIITDDDIELPDFTTSNVSVKAYQAYCKDYIIELLDKGGIPGYYYEPKEETQSMKYTDTSFKSGIHDYVDSVLCDKYEYKMPMSERIEAHDRYKDGHIQNATGEFDVVLLQYDIRFTVFGEIKSGQLCRPRTFEYNGDEYTFNITNINRIIKAS